ncbi:MAG: hypothetical protein ACK4RF_12720 [Cyclobacteriaceae bacterium]
MKLTLFYREVLNGQFETGPLNLMMVFQVNCPGCFIHGFPLVNQLQARYATSLSCFAMATAFEDFEFNTTENVKRLVNTGVLVGETQKAQQAGLLNWTSKCISIPILVDEVVNQSELLQPDFIENTIQNLFRNEETNALHNAKVSLQNYFSHIPRCGKTFAANLMRGTPSFFLFTDSMEVLLHWFGHADSQAIFRELDIFINKKHG